MRLRSIAPLFVGISCGILCGLTSVLATPQAPPAPPVLGAAALSRHTKVLASDEFAGRAPGTAGEAKTVEYLTEQLRKAGALPAGERGGFTQEVAFDRFRIERPPTLSLASATLACTFPLDGAAVIWTKNAAPRVAINAAPLVFLGYGIEAPDRGWNDYAGVDGNGRDGLSGKIAVVLANEPDHERDSGPFAGAAMTYFGRLSHKVEAAARRGALALLVINHPKASGFGWELVQSLYAPPPLDIVRSERRLAFEGWLKLEAAERLFRCAGLDLEAQRQAAQRSASAGVPLPGLSLSVAFSVQVEAAKTRNVLARLPGRSRPDETFVYTAHWDHLGRGKPDPTGDAIYNGAMDNAAGVAGLLELARAFAAAPRTARSLLFIATTLEENGLLGAEFYAAHPLYPLETTVGGINLDAVNVFGPTATLEVTGLGKTTLEDDLERELAKVGRHVRADPNEVVGFYFRSDHFPFVRRGVPFVFAGSGWELAEKKAPNTREPQLGTRFHQPSDEWRPDLDFEAAARDLRVYYEVGRALSDSAVWPQWKPGAEFKALREQSAALRKNRKD